MNTELNEVKTDFVICAEDGRCLLRIDLRAGKVEGSLGDMGDAARVFVEYVRAMLGASTSALSSPPAEDIRALVDHLNGLMDSLDESVSHDQIYDQLLLAWNMARDLRPQPSSPPADDVREALHLLLDEELSDLANRIGREGVKRIADRIAETFDVRPYGAVTNGQLRSRIEQMVANQQSWIDAGRSGQVISRDAMRDALQKALDETDCPHPMTSPAADDVREVVADEAAKTAEDIAHEIWGEGTGFPPGFGPAMIDMLIAAAEAAFEVRPHRTVTDASGYLPGETYSQRIAREARS